jgi:carbamoyltransferase
MRIGGIKLSHDAAVAVIKDGELEFSVELEKMYNQPRYSKMQDLREVDEVLFRFHLRTYNVDHWAVDGWKEPKIDVIGGPVLVAPYHESDPPENEIDLFTREQYVAGFSTYRHVAAHVMAAYASSPWSERHLSSYVLVWDGGMQPRVYYVEPPHMRCERVGEIGDVYGTIYSTMGLFFGMYCKSEVVEYRGEDWYSILKQYCRYDLAGKIMAYIGQGRSSRTTITRLREILDEVEHQENIRRNTLAYDKHRRVEFLFLQKAFQHYGSGYYDPDTLASIHEMLQEKLLEGLWRLVPRGARLCFAGGSALNIKWNSAIRRAGYDLWVPPFPNDCGNAIGVAALENLYQTGNWHMKWDVYSGPDLVPLEIPDGVPKGWAVRSCLLPELAAFLNHNPAEPVVFLLDRAEIGPRALGHRSILMSPFYYQNKQILNRIKGRESFRPVAPMCTVEAAKQYFDPGTADPYMLFDHLVRESARPALPAICHDDNTARLQTVSHTQSPELHTLLTEFGRLSGYPVLCNTSANHSGRGFFPDVQSAMDWGRVDHIWANGFMYSKEEASDEKND